MADCESCKNWDKPTICSTCENGSDFERIVQTNADVIRSMTDEELAEFLGRFATRTCHYCLECGISCKEERIKWLQSEAEREGAERE